MRRAVVHQVPVGSHRNFSYIVACNRAGDCFVVDPAYEPEKLLSVVRAKGYKPVFIANTHNHPDHTEADEPLARRLQIPVVIHEADKQPLERIDAPLRTVTDGSRLKVGELEVECVHAPGHTAGGICYLVDGNLFTGDVLFIGRCGRTDFPGGDKKQMWDTLHRLAQLPPTTEIWPGHDYGRVPHAPLAEELVQNPALSHDDYDTWQRLPFLAKR